MADATKDEAFLESAAIGTAAIQTLSELTYEWKSFGGEAMTDAHRKAFQLLIENGFAKARFTWRISDRATGDWVLLRYSVSGCFAANPATMQSRFAANSPYGWFDQSLNPAPGIQIVGVPQDWTLAITDRGERLVQTMLSKPGLLIQPQANTQSVIIFEESTSRDLPKAVQLSKPQRVNTWHKVFVEAKYSENESERSFRTWLNEQLRKEKAFRKSKKGEISFDLKFLEELNVKLPE